MKQYIFNYNLHSGIYIENIECEWYWCVQCESVSLKFPCCKNSSCNCGGCDKCHDVSVQVSNGEIKTPKKEELIKTRQYLTPEQVKEAEAYNDIFSNYEIYEEE